MRPRITRAVTAALAIVGAAGAIALPTLSLGRSEPPTHAFSLPATRGEVVIEADALPPVVRPADTRPRLDRRSEATASPRPAAQTSVLVATTPKTVPPVTARRATPAPAKAVRVSAPPAPTPTPAPQPEPQPLPQAEPATPAPSAVRLVTSYSPTGQQPGDAGSKSHKPKKDKADKEHGRKQKRDRAPKPAPPALPATATEPALPVEPPTEPGEETTPEDGKHGDKQHGDKEHGGHGNGHDKKK